MRAWAIGFAAVGTMLAQDSLTPSLGQPGPKTAAPQKTTLPPNEKFQAADFLLGTRMIEGTLGPGKSAEGLELVQAAATAKYVPALRYLGNLYELGTNEIPINNKLAALNYKECATTGVLDCQFSLGRVLVSDSLNRIEGMAWLELAAEHGSAEARELFTKELLFTPPAQLEQARAFKKILLPY